MAEQKQKWYPTLDDTVAKVIRDSLRWIFDKVYEVEERRGPTSIYKRSDEPDFEISTGRQNVPGCQLNLTRDGHWVIIGTFCIGIVSDAAKLFTGTLFHQGTTQPAEARLKGPDGLTTTISQCWQIEGQREDTVKLQIIKEDTATGTSVAKGAHSSITALWEGVG